MRTRSHWFWVMMLVACGSQAGSSPSGERARPSSVASDRDGGAQPPNAIDGSAEPLPTDPIVGLWEVSGSDARGSYVGEVEVRAAASAYTFIRAVRYPNVSVEGGRELHWLFRGTLTKGPDGSAIALAGALGRAGFIRKRGAVERTSGEGPLSFSGALTLAAGEVKGAIDVAGESIVDTWRTRKPLPASPIFESKRSVVPAHPPPSPTEKQTNFSLYSGFHGLAPVKPYVGRPEFQSAVHGHIVDPTDRDFYRSAPNALRVVDKIIDEITLAETLQRANAYRYTLAKKTELFELDLENRFVDPDVGMIPDGGPLGGSYAQQSHSYDSALWTGYWIASQVYRHQVTGNAKAKANVLVSLDALLKLQEVTGDFTKFARTMRKAQGSPQPPWYPGAGALSHLEWLSAGNNDMIKGLFYGYLMGWELLCEGGKTGHESMCARIVANAKHLADDLKLEHSEGGSNPIAQLSNSLPANWLYAVVADNPGDVLTYQSKASGLWVLIKTALPQTVVTYNQGTVDWSGTQLSSIGNLIGLYLAKRMNLGGDALDAYRSHVDVSHKNLEKQRFPNWHLLKAALGTGAGASSPFIPGAIARLEELPHPKVSFLIDRRLGPEFCVSPYPVVPWKGDFMNYPAVDRTQALDSVPFFEMRPDVMSFKLGNDYVWSWEGYENPGPDLVHVYWFARKFGLIDPSL